MFTVYADVQSVCGICCRPSSQFSQTYNLFRRRIVCLRHWSQTQFTVFAQVHSFLRVYIFRRPSSLFSQTCSLFVIFVADLVCLLFSSLPTKVGNHENMQHELPNRHAGELCALGHGFSRSRQLGMQCIFSGEATHCLSQYSWTTRAYILKLCV